MLPNLPKKEISRILKDTYHHFNRAFAWRAGRHLKRSATDEFWTRATECCCRWHIAPEILIFAVSEYVNYDPDKGAVATGAALFRSEDLMERGVQGLSSFIDMQIKKYSPGSLVLPEDQVIQVSNARSLHERLIAAARLCTAYSRYGIWYIQRKNHESGFSMGEEEIDRVVYRRHKGNPFLLFHLGRGPAIKDFATRACQHYLNQHPWAQWAWPECKGMNWEPSCPPSPAARLIADELFWPPDLQSDWSSTYLPPDKSNPDLGIDSLFLRPEEHQYLTTIKDLVETGRLPAEKIPKIQ